MQKEWFQSNFCATKSQPSQRINETESILNKKAISQIEKRKLSSESDDGDDVIFCGDVEKEKKKKDDDHQAFQSIDWLKKFHPKDIADLAVHPKKLEDLKTWFRIAFAKTPNKILIVEGPTGCAKSTALKLVAKESGYSINEWTNSTYVDSEFFDDSSNPWSNREFVTNESQVSKFADFLFRTSRYNSVFDNDDRIIMVKDLPNTFLKKTEDFWKILKQYSEDGRSPLVFIVTETSSKSLNISYNLFPAKIRAEFGIDTIAFNAVAATLMKRAMKRVVQMVESNSNYKPFFKRPTEEIMSVLIEQCQGDLRNAILNLNFASQQSDFKFTMPKAVKPRKGSKKKKTTASIKDKDEGGLGKNEVLSLMHGLGRVFHPKRELNEKTQLFELTHKPETLTESFRSQPLNFIAILHSNYMKNFSDINSIATASEMLSMSDCLSSEYRDEQLAHVNLNLVVRATMVLNEKPAGGFRTITAKGDKKWRLVEEETRQRFIDVSKTLINNGNIMTKNDFFCDYNDFLKIISGK